MQHSASCEDTSEGVGLTGVAGEVTAELHQKEADGSSSMMRWGIWHGGIQLRWRESGQDVVDHLLGRLDLSQECRFWEGVTREFSVAVPFKAVPTNFMSDEVAQVAAKVKGKGAHGVWKAGNALPQEIVGSGFDFLGKGVQVSGENVLDVLHLLGRFRLIHAANFDKPPLSEWVA